MGPLRLWRASIALRRRGHGKLASLLQALNSLLYSNSLSSRASPGPGLWLGHHAFGTVIEDGVTIGHGVTIWHNVSLVASGRSDTRLLIEDDVNIGASAIVAAEPGRSLRIGRGARIGAGTVVTGDVPAGATVVAARTRLTHARDPAEPR